MITLQETNCNFEREPLLAPFGFKGRTLSELWQTVVKLADDRGQQGVGLGTQSVLWSDAGIFSSRSEAAGNSLMFQLTAHALERCRGRSFDRPETLLEEILPEVLAFARTLVGGPVRPTFALNALVAVDNAAWRLYAAHQGLASFDDLIGGDYRAALPARHSALAAIPLIPYGMSCAQAADLARAGHFILKIKIGRDPDLDGNRDKMLAWDCERITQLHAALESFSTPYTTHGRLAYYLDANGQYDSMERLQRLLDHCERIGALEQVILLEEPFPEEELWDVSQLPVRVAADESAHSVEDVTARIDAGYRAIALKPIAKTLSLSLRMAAVAAQRQIPCFCADLTVNPVLVDWGKNVAARLPVLPGLKCGVLESNGAQNYRDWARLRSYHPNADDATWIDPRAGLFELDDRFYATAGGILQASAHYDQLVAK